MTGALERLPEGDELLLRAGIGWEEGLVGRAREESGLDSQAGFTLLSEEPVIVEDLREEERFRASALLHDHGAVSGLSVIISDRGQPFGVLGAHTQSLTAAFISTEPRPRNRSDRTIRPHPRESP